METYRQTRCTELLMHAQTACGENRNAGPFYATNKNIWRRVDGGEDRIVAYWSAGLVVSFPGNDLRKGLWGPSLLAAIRAVNGGHAKAQVARQRAETGRAA